MRNIRKQDPTVRFSFPTTRKAFKSFFLYFRMFTQGLLYKEPSLAYVCYEFLSGAVLNVCCNFLSFLFKSFPTSCTVGVRYGQISQKVLGHLIKHFWDLQLDVYCWVWLLLYKKCYWGWLYFIKLKIVVVTSWDFL